MITKIKDKKEKITSAHFKAEDRFITQFPRDLWSEGEYRKAMDLLESCNVNFQQAYAIIRGELKFVEFENTQTFTLEPDDWKPNLSTCHFGQYPDPDNEEEMQAAKRVLLADTVKEDYSRKLSILMRKSEGIRSAEGRLREFFIDNDFEKDILEASFNLNWLILEKDIDALVRVAGMGGFRHGQPISEHYFPSNFENSIKQNVDTFLEQDAINADLDKQRKLKPSDVYENGIITEDGLFYRCGSMGHDKLATRLGYGELEEGHDNTELAMQDGCVVVSLSIASKRLRLPPKHIPLTEKQEDTVQRWLQVVSYSLLPLEKIYTSKAIIPNNRTHSRL